HLLGLRLGRRQEAGAEPRRGDDRLADRVRHRAPPRPVPFYPPRTAVPARAPCLARMAGTVVTPGPAALARWRPHHPTAGPEPRGGARGPPGGAGRCRRGGRRSEERRVGKGRRAAW